jgi:hypothetical protein
MDGQTFAIAGLMNNTMTSTLQKIPGIGDIPILGLLFKSKSAQKNLTELVVMITPHILPRNSAGVTTHEPPLVEPYLPALPQKDQMPQPPPAFRQPVSPRADNVAPAAPTTPTVATPTVTTPSEAAATLLKSSPSKPPVMQIDVQPAPPVSNAPRPLTGDEQKMLDRAHKQDELKKATDARERMKQAQVDQEKDKAGQQQRARAAMEQAARDEAAAKVAGEKAKRQADVDAKAAKAAAEQAKRQAEIDGKAAKIAAEEGKRQAALGQERQKALDAAAALTKAAEARYQTELAKKQK